MAETVRHDPLIQQQVDAQLLEQGAFSPLELLFETGRLSATDYESWRRCEVRQLDEVLMGSLDKIRQQLEQAISYARSIGLTEQPQQYHPWRTQQSIHEERPLMISNDAQLQRLIASRYVPAQKIPQLDLFFDNPVVALTNGIVRALSARDASQAQRQLDRLYAQAPNHADLPGFDQLLLALSHLDRADLDPRQELAFLLEITPTARRLLGPQARDLLAPLWRALANTLREAPFLAGEPELHRSFALTQAQDWAGVSESVHEVPHWWLHAPLCQRLLQSAFYRQRRMEALATWFQLCWHHPVAAESRLDAQRHTDINLARAWQAFLDTEAGPGESAPLQTADFPAWLLLHDPALGQQLPLDLPKSCTPGEEHYRVVHSWIHARMSGREDEELSLRKTLRASQPALFHYLRERAATSLVGLPR